MRSTKSAVATAGLVTLATGGAILTGAAAAQPAALLDATTGSLNLDDLQAASAERSAMATLPSRSDDRAGDRADVRRSGDRREIVDRGAVVSRDGDREAPGSPSAADTSASTAVEALSRAPKLVQAGDQKLLKRWTTTALDLWAGYGKHSTKLGEIAENKVVYATGRRESGRVQLVLDGDLAWVTAGYLSASNPSAASSPSATAAASTSSNTTAALDFSACGDASVEDNLTAGAVKVYRAVCNAFPEVASGTTYGYDPHGEHSSGKALDFMIDGDVDLGYRIRDFVQAHAAELDLYDIIYRQHIWTPVRASEGWRLMEDRGDPTANHMDHVHVSVN